MNTLLGADSLSTFCVLYFFACIGLAVSLLLHAEARDKSATSTPVKFSLVFLLTDNWKRIFLSLLLIFIAIRFYPDLFHQDINPFVSLGVGLGLDKIAQLIKTKTGVLDVDRTKIQ